MSRYFPAPARKFSWKVVARDVRCDPLRHYWAVVRWGVRMDAALRTEVLLVAAVLPVVVVERTVVHTAPTGFHAREPDALRGDIHAAESGAALHSAGFLPLDAVLAHDVRFRYGAVE